MNLLADTRILDKHNTPLPNEALEKLIPILLPVAKESKERIDGN
jgi:hypothetical protein